MSCAASAPLIAVEPRPCGSVVICTVPTSSEWDSLRLKNGDTCTKSCQDIEECGASGIEADAVEDKAGVGEKRGGAEEERSRRNVAGDSGFDCMQVCGPVIVTESMDARELGAECAKSEFAVVAGAHGFADGGVACCLKASQKDTAFDLRARNRSGVVHGSKRCCRGS